MTHLRIDWIGMCPDPVVVLRMSYYGFLRIQGVVVRLVVVVAQLSVTSGTEKGELNSFCPSLKIRLSCFSARYNECIEFLFVFRSQGMGS